MLFVAAFLAGLRWLVVTARANGRLDPEFDGEFVLFGLLLVALCIAGVKTYSPVSPTRWLAVYLVRRRPVRWLLRLRK